MPIPHLTPYSYQPRQAFIPFHNRTTRDALLVCHRRSGKTVALVNDLVIGALETTLHRPQFAYIAPTYVQAKRIAWQYLIDYARPLYYPGSKPNESELRVDLVSASNTPARIFLAGADNPDSLRGIYLDGAVVDEDALIPPSVTTQILIPALADRQGWLVKAGTPKGRNHFYDNFRRVEQLVALDPPQAFLLYLKASESGILPPEELASMRSRMEPEEYEQEMECSFTATAKGLILFRLMILLRLATPPRLGNPFFLPLPPGHSEVIASSDIGYRDQAAFWFWQCGPGPHELRLIHYMEHSGLDAEDWIDLIHRSPYPPNVIYLPPDARAKTFSTKHSPHEQFMRAARRGAFAPNARIQITPRTSIPDRINAARTVLPFCTFVDTPDVNKGVTRLENWSYDYDEETHEFSATPKHDIHSHGGDAFSYGAQMLAYHGPTPPPDPPDPTYPIPGTQGAHYAFTLDSLWEDHRRGRI